MTNDDTIALVTGANKGIGRETVRRLAEQGWTVWLGSRDGDRGRRAAAELESVGKVRPVELDVTDDESVAIAAKTLEAADGRIDVLVNNAGIGGPWIGPEETEPSHFLPVFGVNLLGPVRTTHAFLPLLRRSTQPRIVMVSSGMGSFGITTDPERIESTLGGLIYPASKAALNTATDPCPGEGSRSLTSRALSSGACGSEWLGRGCRARPGSPWSRRSSAS